MIIFKIDEYYLLMNLYLFSFNFIFLNSYYYIKEN
jgi:hypothetical protein